MKLPSFVSDIHRESPARIDSQSLLNSLANIRWWLLLLATVHFLSFIGLFCGVVVLATRRGTIGPNHVIYSIVGILLVSIVPILMIIYAYRIKEFIKDTSPGNFLSLLVAQRYLWTMVAFFMLLGVMLGVVALLMKYLAG